MEGARHVARGEHVRRRRAQGRVGDDPVVDLQPGRLRERGVRDRADADHHEVGGHLGVAVDQDRGHAPAGPAELADARAGAQVDAVVPVQLGEHRPHLRAEDRVQRRGLRLDDGDLVAVAARGRTHLEPDPARADDDHPAAPAGQVGQQPVGVGQGAQVADAARGRPRAARAGVPRNRWRAAAGRSRRSSPVSSATVLAGDVQTGGAHPGPELDVVLGVPAGVVHASLLALGAAEQVALRQRRPLVGHLRLAGDQDDAPVEALRAQGLGRLRAGQPTADDHLCRHGSHSSGRAMVHARPPSWPRRRTPAGTGRPRGGRRAAPR